MKISIIIPVYNKQRYLHTLLHQIQEQTFRDFECLLIDDGSTDNSGSICDEFACQDPRFRVFHIPNGGVSHARNVGLDHAAGEYITFIDGDDEVTKHYLKNLHDCIADRSADLVISGFTKFWDDQEDTTLFVHPDSPHLCSLAKLLPGFARVQRSTGFYGYCWAKIFPARLVSGIRFDETLRLAEDFDFYLRLYPLVKTVFLDDKANYRYRQEAENSSVLTPDDQIDYTAQLKINLRYRDFLISQNAYSEENKQLIDSAIHNYLYFSLFYCPLSRLRSRFSELSEVCRGYSLRPCGRTVLQKLLLGCLRYNLLFGVRFFLGSYRLLRKVRNTIRKGAVQ